MQTQPDRLLLIQPRWLGDVLLCTPAIRVARHAFPDARIDFLTEGPGAAALANNPHLDSVLVDDGSVRSRLRLIREVRATRYDAIVDFRSTNSTAQVVWASRAGVRIGIRGRGPRNLAYTRLVDRLEIPQYAARHKLDMLGGVGVPVQYINDLSLDLPLDRQHRQAADVLWQAEELVGESVIAVTPVSREAFKQWGAEKWAMVADWLIGQGYKVLFTHGPGEREQVEAVVGRMTESPIWEVETATVQHLAAILERCEHWVGNEGGVKHIAAAVGLPTFSVSRWRIGPVWNDPTADAPQRFIDREPPGGCELHCDNCHENGCLAALSPADVQQALAGALAAPGA